MTAHNAHTAQDAAATAGRLAGIVMMGCCWSVTALGAANSVADNAAISDQLQSLDLDAPATTLSITLADPVENDAEPGIVNPLDADDVTADSTVPVLYLTPRVASMLREVFNEDVSVPDAAKRKSAPKASEEARSDASLPPIATGKTGAPSLPRLEVKGLSSQVKAIPQFQRPMYRTDI